VTLLLSILLILIFRWFDVSILYFDTCDIVGIPESSTVGVWSGSVISVLRAPTDPIYRTFLILQNVADGSAYWVAESADLNNVLALGNQSGTGNILIDVPATSENMLVTIRVRKGSSGIKYKPFETQTPLSRGSALSYILQTIDPIA
jgi:hypothetical protein